MKSESTLDQKFETYHFCIHPSLQPNQSHRWSYAVYSCQHSTNVLFHLNVSMDYSFSVSSWNHLKCCRLLTFGAHSTVVSFHHSFLLIRNVFLFVMIGFVFGNYIVHMLRSHCKSIIKSIRSRNCTRNSRMNYVI